MLRVIKQESAAKPIDKAVATLSLSNVGSDYLDKSLNISNPCCGVNPSCTTA